jgi:hypothetical protein
MDLGDLADQARSVRDLDHVCAHPHGGEKGRTKADSGKQEANVFVHHLL